MAQSMVSVVAASVLVCTTAYLWWLNRGLKTLPPELKGVLLKPWTKDELRAAYKKVQDSPTDVRPFLHPKRDRRYIVSGGSGVVGGWIVNHLLQRGENPAAIRILDLRPSTRPEVAANGVKFFATDVGDQAAVFEAFQAPWPNDVAKRPLTVFHTVAYINPSERKPDCMPMYQRVNINGTQHMLDAATVSGASVFISTSSGGVGIKPINFFFPPWKKFPDNIVQPLADTKLTYTEGKLEDYGSCYTYSKITAENLVKKADNRNGLRTGVLRPGHILYGHGVESNSNAVYDYLDRGGSPSWLHNLAIAFGNGQNISIAHLAFENTLLTNPNSKAGGQSYYCSDPNPPRQFWEMYDLLSTLVHPMKPCVFADIPAAPIILLSYIIESYKLLRMRYLSFLPPITGDLGMMQPALFQMSTIHTVYDNTAAEQDLGYKPPISTLEGLAHQVFFFNQLIEKQVHSKVAKGKGGELEVEGPGVVPKPL